MQVKYVSSSWRDVNILVVREDPGKLAVSGMIWECPGGSWRVWESLGGSGRVWKGLGGSERVLDG